MLDSIRKEQKLVNTISILANLLVVSNFLMFRFASDSNRWTLNLTIISWTIFVAALVSVNAWLYFSYYKKTIAHTKT
jgi:hypothetical protein